MGLGGGEKNVEAFNTPQLPEAAAIYGLRKWLCGLGGSGAPNYKSQRALRRQASGGRTPISFRASRFASFKSSMFCVRNDSFATLLLFSSKKKLIANLTEPSLQEQSGI